MAPQSWATSAGTRKSMLGNRRTNTKPEVALRSALHALGLRFRKDHRIDVGDVTIRADVVFTKARLAVFVDGCYWHSCPQHGTKPKRNAEFWAKKFERNAQRDREQTAALRDAGWTVLRVWEHVPVADAAANVAAALDGPLDRRIRVRLCE